MFKSKVIFIALLSSVTCSSAQARTCTELKNEISRIGAMILSDPNSGNFIPGHACINKQNSRDSEGNYVAQRVSFVSPDVPRDRDPNIICIGDSNRRAYRVHGERHLGEYDSSYNILQILSMTTKDNDHGDFARSLVRDQTFNSKLQGPVREYADLTTTYFNQHCDSDVNFSLLSIRALIQNQQQSSGIRPRRRSILSHRCSDVMFANEIITDMQANRRESHRRQHYSECQWPSRAAAATPASTVTTPAQIAEQAANQATTLLNDGSVDRALLPVVEQGGTYPSAAEVIDQAAGVRLGAGAQEQQKEQQR